MKEEEEELVMDRRGKRNGPHREMQKDIMERRDGKILLAEGESD